MLLTASSCTQTVSILEALIFGAGEACIDLSVPSLLGGVIAFIGAVIALRTLGLVVLRRVFPCLRQRSEPEIPVQAAAQDTGVQPMPYESPIRSTGAWGGRKS